MRLDEFSNDPVLNELNPTGILGRAATAVSAKLGNNVAKGQQESVARARALASEANQFAGKAGKKSISFQDLIDAGEHFPGWGFGNQKGRTAAAAVDNTLRTQYPINSPALTNAMYRYTQQLSAIRNSPPTPQAPAAPKPVAPQKAPVNTQPSLDQLLAQANQLSPDDKAKFAKELLSTAQPRRG